MCRSRPLFSSAPSVSVLPLCESSSTSLAVPSASVESTDAVGATDADGVLFAPQISTVPEVSTLVVAVEVFVEVARLGVAVVRGDVIGDPCDFLELVADNVEFDDFGDTPTVVVDVDTVVVVAVGAAPRLFDLDLDRPIPPKLSSSLSITDDPFDLDRPRPSESESDISKESRGDLSRGVLDDSPDKDPLNTREARLIKSIII